MLLTKLITASTEGKIHERNMEGGVAWSYDVQDHAQKSV